MRFYGTTFLLVSMGLAEPFAFGLDLQQAYQEALIHDPSWSATINRYQASLELRNQARSALLPNFSASASLGSNHINPSEPIPFIGLYNRTFTSKSYGIQGIQSLFNADAWHGYQQARALTSAASADFAQAQQKFILDIATAYFNVLRARENLVYAQAEELAIGRQFAQTKKRFEVGMASITEVHEAQAASDTSSAERISAETAVSSAEAELGIHTGGEITQLAILRPDAPVTDTPKDPESVWIQRAQQQNPVLRSARFAYQAAQETTRQKQSGYLPSLQLVGNWQDMNTGGASPLQDGKNSAIALQLSVPLYAGGLTHSQVRQSLANEYAAQDQLDFQHRQVTQDIHIHYLQVNRDAAQVNARQQALASSQSALQATEAGYDVGTRDIVEVMQAQKDLYAAKSAYANARYDYVLDGLRLKSSAGQLGNMDIVALNQWLDPQAHISVDTLNPEIQQPPENIPAPPTPHLPPGRRHQ